MPEEASSTFHPPKQEMRPPSSVCCRRVLNVLEGFASVFYISNKSRLLAFAATTIGDYCRLKGGDAMPWSVRSQLGISH